MTNNKENQKRCTFWLNKELWEHAMELAKEQDLNLAQWMRRAIFEKIEGGQTK